MAALLAVSQFFLPAQSRLIELTTSKKLKIRFLQNKNIPYVHAQLLIFYSQEPFSAVERAKANLTLFSLFGRDLEHSRNSVQSALSKLSNEVEFEQRPDFLRITIDFLPDRMGQLATFINRILSYQSFAPDRFNLTRERYWNLLTSSRDWGRELALQIAYGHFFFQASGAPALTTPESLRHLSVAHIRSFHRRTFRPDNALLVIKGNVNPYISLGLLEKEMQSNWPPARPEPRPETTITPNSRIYVLNTPGSDSVNLYFFDLAPALPDPDFLPVYLLNQVLFGFPTGRLFQSTRALLRSRTYQFDNELFVCRPLPLICQHARIQYDVLEEFISLIDGEKRKLARTPITHGELLSALNSVMGRLDVASADVDHEVNLEVDRFVSNHRENPIAYPAAFKDVSLERINRIGEGNKPFRPRGNGTDRGVLVIMGDTGEIRNRLKMLRSDMIELNTN
jgi:predicted Zn-dependent peptidase